MPTREVSPKVALLTTGLALLWMLCIMVALTAHSIFDPKSWSSTPEIVTSLIILGGCLWMLYIILPPSIKAIWRAIQLPKKIIPSDKTPRENQTSG